MKWTRTALALLFLAALSLCVYVIIHETGSSSPGLPPAPEPAPTAAQSQKSGKDSSPSNPSPAGAEQPATAIHSPVTRTQTRSAPLPGQADPSDPLSRSLLGLVKDTEGNPLPGVRVILADPPGKSGQKSMETRTDPRGQFRLGPLDLDQKSSRFRSYQVEVTAPGYYPEVHPFRPGAEREVILTVPGSLAGQVVVEGKEGRPCPDATLALQGPGNHRFRTDAAGYFEVAQLRPGNYRVDVQPEENPPILNAVVRIRPRNRTEVRFEVKSGIRVCGTVTDHLSGKPLPGVRVFTWVSYQKPSYTGPDGQFVLNGLPRKISLRFYKKGFLHVYREVKAKKEEEEEKSLDVAMRRPGRIRGVVLDPEGKPVDFARVSLIDERIRTNHKGEFTIPDVWPDQNLRVRAWKRGFKEGRSTKFSVADGQEVTGIQVRLRDPSSPSGPLEEKITAFSRRTRGLPAPPGIGVITGKFQDESGTAIPRAKVRLFFLGRGGDRSRRNIDESMRYIFHTRAFKTATSGEEGAFRFEKLRAGRYVFETSATGYGTEAGKTIVLAEGGAPHHEIVVLQKGFTAACTAVDEKGLPLRTASISAYRKDTTYRSHVRARTGMKGEFTLGPVVRHPYLVRAYQPGRRFKVVETTFTRDGQTLLRFERISLTTGQRAITGRVVFAGSGAPVPSFWVRLHLRKSLGEKKFVDAQGQFVWSGLKEGTYAVEAGTDKGWVTRGPIPVVVGGDGESFSLVIELHEGGKVHGVVLDPLGRPAAGTKVTLHRKSPLAPAVASARTEADGAFRFKSLAPGDYFAVATHDLWVEGWDRFTTTTGKTSRSRITLLAEGGAVQVLARDEAGNPVKDVVVYLHRIDGNFSRVFVPTLSQIKSLFHRRKARNPLLAWGPFFNSFSNTDRDGMLVHPVLPPGRYRIRGSKVGVGSGTEKVDVYDRLESTVRLVLKRKPISPPGR